jgi:hypothetical protein
MNGAKKQFLIDARRWGWLHSFVSVVALLAVFSTARAQEVIEQIVDAQPMAVLSKKNFLVAAQVGISVAADYNPEVKPFKVAADIAVIALDETLKSAEARNAALATHLVMLNDDISRLQELKKRDGNLRSPEAQAILDNFRRNPFPSDSEGMFLAKSVFSLRVVVGTAGHYGIRKGFELFLGKRLAKRMHVGEKAERIWISKNSPVRLYTNIEWKYLKQLGTGTRILGDKLMKAIIVREAKELGKATFGEVLDHAVDTILAEHPSHKSAVYTLRSDLFNNPALLVQPAPAAVIVPAPVPAIVPMPAVVMVPNDPVIRPAYVQHQAIEQNAGRSHDGNPPSDGHRSSHQLPTSISGGGSFGSFSFGY